MAYFVQLCQLILVLINAEYYPKNIIEYAKSQFSDELRQSMIDRIRKATEDNEKIIVINDKDRTQMKNLEQKLRKDLHLAQFQLENEQEQQQKGNNKFLSNEEKFENEIDQKKNVLMK